MSGRLPYAARTLIEQVQAEKPKATYETVGEPDGFRVNRTIKFDKRTSKWLAPLLVETEDERIAEASLTDAGYLHVRFVGSPVADQRDEFPLVEAETVLAEEQPQPDPDSQ